MNKTVSSRQRFIPSLLLTIFVVSSWNSTTPARAAHSDALAIAQDSANRWEKLEGYAITYRLKHSRYGKDWVKHTFWFGPSIRGEKNNRKFRYTQEIENPGEPHLPDSFILDKAVSWNGRRGTRYERRYVTEAKQMIVSRRYHGTTKDESARIDSYAFLPTLLAGVNVVANPLQRAMTVEEDMDRWTYIADAEGEKFGMPATRVRWYLSELGDSDKWLRQAWFLTNGMGLPVEFLFEDREGENQDDFAHMTVDDIVKLPNGQFVPQSGAYKRTSQGVNLDYEFEFLACVEIEKARMKDWFWEPPTGTRTHDLFVSEINLTDYTPEEERMIREYLLTLKAPGGGFLSRWGWTIFNIICIGTIAYTITYKIRQSFRS